jgi:transposase InsO family protein
MPRLLAPAEQRRICAARKQTGWGPRLLTLRTGYSHSTISKVLRRHGLSRPARLAREPGRRYEWPCPGDLLHMDVTLYARFARPGHAVTGDRHSTAAEKRARVGYDFAHAIVDDHSRFAYVELLDDQRAPTVTGFVERALAAFARQGIRAERLMTDNYWSYTKNGSLRELLAKQRIQHLTTRPRRPQTNGKVERFHQTMAREGAYGLRYRSSRHRAAALPHWLRYYNERRPHSSPVAYPRSAAFTTCVGRTASDRSPRRCVECGAVSAVDVDGCSLLGEERADARPIPPYPPVIRATLFSSLISTPRSRIPY